MKRYSVSLTVSYTEKDLVEAGLSHLTEDEIQQALEEQLSELVNSPDYYHTEFKVEEA